MDLSKLRDSLIEKHYDQEKVNKFIAYLSGEESKPQSVVHRHSIKELYNLFVRYYNAGTNLDGINVVLSGKNMALITYHGFMNKVKANHKDVFFDVQIVRKGDTFNFAKESGSVVYSHQIGDPFANEPIIGAYCVVRFDNNESLELLNERDYNEMKASSRNSSVWDKWSTEFWRKSVIKRACKIYFAEDISQLEEIDNEDYGLSNEKASEDLKDKILESHGKAE